MKIEIRIAKVFLVGAGEGGCKSAGNVIWYEKPIALSDGTRMGNEYLRCISCDDGSHLICLKQQ